MKKKTLIQKINDSPFKVYCAIAGAGQSFAVDFLRVSGASNTILGIQIPYSQYAFDKFVGRKVEKYVSEEAARKLAVAAYNECLAAGIESKNAIGLSATCSLAKDNERSGREHKMHIAVHTRNITLVVNGIFRPGLNRTLEERTASQFLLAVLNKTTCNIKPIMIPDELFGELHADKANGMDISFLLENPNKIIYLKDIIYR